MRSVLGEMMDQRKEVRWSLMCLAERSGRRVRSDDLCAVKVLDGWSSEADILLRSEFA